MTDEDVQKIQAIVDGLDAAIRAEWPGLVAHRLNAVGVPLDRDIRHILQTAVIRMRADEARAEAERKRIADLDAAQAARPDHAQRAYDGVWWWHADGRWTNGIDRSTRPPSRVRWRATIGDGTRAHVVDGEISLCGRWARGLVMAEPDVPVCARCQKVADREVTRD